MAVQRVIRQYISTCCDGCRVSQTVGPSAGMVSHSLADLTQCMYHYVSSIVPVYDVLCTVLYLAGCLSANIRLYSLFLIVSVEKRTKINN